jgi:hypothetical protein
MTIAQQLKIKDFPFVIYDKNRNEIYCENSNGYWWKYEYNDNGNRIYYEDSYGHWHKREYDDKGNEIYFENSNGLIIDNIPKPCEDKIIEMDGVKYKLVKL